MFEITEFAEARLASVTTRTEKHGDEEVPAVTLAIELTTANTILDGIDPGLRHALYKAVEDQDQLPGVEPATPVLRSNVIDKVILTTAHEGWRLSIDDGIDDTTPMRFGSVKVDKLKIDAKQGGSIVLGLRLGTSDIDAERAGKLAMHNGQSIWVQLLKPEKAPDVIDGTTGHPGLAALQAEGEPDATDLFAAGGTDDGDPVSEPPAELDRSENWPFPRGGSETSDEDRSRLSREAELQAEAAAGAGEKPSRRQRKAAVGSVE